MQTRHAMNNLQDNPISAFLRIIGAVVRYSVFMSIGLLTLVGAAFIKGAPIIIAGLVLGLIAYIAGIL